MPSIRLNPFKISHFDSRQDGVMRVEAIARTPGILTYRKADGSSRRELVHPEFLKARTDANEPLAAQLAGIPVSNEHPPGLFRHDSSLWSRKVGETEPEVEVFTDGRIKVKFWVDDPKTQEDIRSGRKDGVSLGYECGTREEQGTYLGQRYDAVQCEPFKGDHLAVVTFPRAADARITRFDSDDSDFSDVAIAIDSLEEDSDMTNRLDAKKAKADPPEEEMDEEEMGEEEDELPAFLKKKKDAKKAASEPEEDEEEEDEEEDEEEEEEGNPLAKYQFKKKDGMELAEVDVAIAGQNLRLDSDAVGAVLAGLPSELLQTVFDSLDEENLKAAMDSLENHLDMCAACAPMPMGMGGMEPDMDDMAVSGLDPEDIQDMIDDAVSARLAEMEEAFERTKEYLPEDFNPFSVDEPVEYLVEAIKTVAPSMKLTDKSDEMIEGIFEGMFASRSDSEDLPSLREDTRKQLLSLAQTNLENRQPVQHISRLDADDPNLSARERAQIRAYQESRAPLN